MNPREMKKFEAHCSKYLQQDNCMVMHSDTIRDPHIDFLKYPPNDHLPYWKLVTMGASDIKMPNQSNTLGDRNEYIVFISPDTNLDDYQTFAWFANKLLMIAKYPQYAKAHITYGHSVEWGDEDGSDMVSAFLEMPQILGSPECMRCNLSMFKKIVILQPIMLTREETNRLLSIGPERFSYYLYPEDGSTEKVHFICEQNRTEQF